VLRFGYLGTARVRRALLGRQLHERFSIELDEDADGSVDAVPLDGILEADATRMNSLRRSLVSGKQMLAARTWPGVELSQRGPRSSADMEILNICEARLYRRTATLTQVGMVFAPGDAGYPLRRKGVLGWTAIEAKCPAPDGNIRLQAGPFYRRVGEEENSRLADWNSSYIRLRPPLEHPEEWRVVRDEPWKVVNERMAPIRKQIGDLQTAQERADTSCQFSKKCESPQQTEQRRQQLGRLVQEAIERQKALKCEIEKKCE